MINIALDFVTISLKSVRRSKFTISINYLDPCTNMVVVVKIIISWISLAEQ